MKIAVCEDQTEAMTLLCDNINIYFEKMSYLGQIETFKSGEGLLEAFAPGKYELIFLDIMLPGLTGIEIAQKIREVDPNCLIVFVTISVDYAMDSYNVQAAGYVIKPVTQEKMDKALHLCHNRLIKSARAIDIPSGRGGSVLSLPLSNIQYVEVYGKYSKFSMHGGIFEARLTLDEVDSMLGGEPFLRCHRSYMVNMNHVAQMSDSGFVMRNGDVVPMRTNGRKKVKVAFARFMANHAAFEV